MDLSLSEMQMILMALLRMPAEILGEEGFQLMDRIVAVGQRRKAEIESLCESGGIPDLKM